MTTRIHEHDRNSPTMFSRDDLKHLMKDNADMESDLAHTFSLAIDLVNRGRREKAADLLSATLHAYRNHTMLLPILTIGAAPKVGLTEYQRAFIAEMMTAIIRDHERTAERAELLYQTFLQEIENDDEPGS